jgi:hypothetical protein
VVADDELRFAQIGDRHSDSKGTRFAVVPLALRAADLIAPIGSANKNRVVFGGRSHGDGDTIPKPDCCLTPGHRCRVVGWRLTTPPRGFAASPTHLNPRGSPIGAPWRKRCRLFYLGDVQRDTWV